MKHLTLLILPVLLIATGCKKNCTDETEAALLDNSKWKVSNTTWEFPNGHVESFGFETNGFYLDLNEDNTFSLTHHPYTFTETGNWNYDSRGKELTLRTGASGSMHETVFTVLQLSQNRLVLFILNGDNVKYTRELRPY